MYLFSKELGEYMSSSEPQDLTKKLNDSTTSKEEKILLMKKFASQLTDDLNTVQFLQFYATSFGSISEKDKKISFSIDILNEIIQSQLKLRKNASHLITVISKETISSLNDQSAIIKYLETLFGKYSPPKEDFIGIVLLILNTGLEKLIEHKQTLSGASVLRTQIQKLLNLAFKADKQIIYLKTEIQQELDKSLKYMATLQEDTFLSTELAINLKALVDLGRYDDLSKILTNILALFPKNPVKVTLLYDLIVYTCKPALTTKPDENSQRKTSWMMKFLSNYFKVDKWFYVETETILPKEKTLQLITDLLNIFPQQLYTNENDREPLITIREHLGRGFVIMLEQDKYQQFLSNELLPGLKFNSNIIIASIKNDIFALNHENKKNLFQLYSTPLWEYLHTLDKERLYALSEITFIYSSYALETEKSSKDDIAKTTILFNQLLK